MVVLALINVRWTTLAFVFLQQLMYFMSLAIRQNIKVKEQLVNCVSLDKVLLC